MIAFYALSNQMLLNVASIKLAHFQDETADLIVRGNNSHLSMKLVRAYVDNGTFRAVHSIPFPFYLRPETGKYGKIPGLRKITFFGDHYRYNEMVLSRSVNGTKYDRFVVPYLGNNVQFAASYLKSCNPNIEFVFYEDGVFSYTRPASQFLGHVYLGKRNWKEFIADWIGEEHFLRPLRRNAKPVIYLHVPKREILDPWFQNAQFIPPISQYLQYLRPLESMAKQLDKGNVERYRRRMAVFLSGPYSPMSNRRLENCEAMEEDLPSFEIMCQIFGHDNCILKPHPVSKIVLDHLGKVMEQTGLYVDRNMYLFEVLFLVIENGEDLVLISRYSAALFNIKFWFDKEPYILYTYRLHPAYAADLDYTVDRYIQEARKAYRDPSRIMIPNSMAEYEEMLKWARKRILNRKYPCSDSDETEA